MQNNTKQPTGKCEVGYATQEASKETQVDGAINGLFYAVNSLADTVQWLEIRLQPLTREPYQSDPPGCSPQPVLVPVASRVQSETDRIAAVELALLSILERLEV